MERETLSEYQELVNALMLLGWYRTGEGPPDSLGHTLWGFRHGHRTDAEQDEMRWVPAATELDAMRTVLTQLRHAETESAAPESHESERRSPDDPGSGARTEKGD